MAIHLRLGGALSEQSLGSKIFLSSRPKLGIFSICAAKTSFLEIPVKPPKSQNYLQVPDSISKIKFAILSQYPRSICYSENREENLKGAAVSRAFLFSLQIHRSLPRESRPIPRRQDDREKFRRGSLPRLFTFQMKKEPATPSTQPSACRNRFTASRRGDIGEAVFLAKATSLGFDVARPWGNSSPFDFIVHSGRHCWRVQVKSAHHPDGRRYTVRARADNFSYTRDNLDFLVAVVVPENVWYVVPVEALGTLPLLWLCPYAGSAARFERYREAWCLMACPRDGAFNPEISVWRRCLAGEGGECPFRPAGANHVQHEPKG